MTTELWLWRDFEKQYALKVFEFINSNSDECKELITLYTNEANCFDKGFLLTEYILQFCQAVSLIDNERTTYLSYKDHLLALELCISQTKRTNGGDSKVTKDDVANCHNIYQSICLYETEPEKEQSKYLDAYKEFLIHSNCTEIWHLNRLMKDNATLVREKISELTKKTTILIIGNCESEIYVHLIKLLANGESAVNITIESPLDASLNPSIVDTDEITINKESVLICDDLIYSEMLTDISATMEYGEEVIIAFLCLLVNCRNELSLSRAMSSPIVALSHSAFTDLKHVAVEKQMPMCQTVISYVTRIRLGGKGYAPPKDCPLLCHLKGLGIFVDLINKLQTILEEEPVTHLAVEKVINIIKKRLLNTMKKNMRESSIIEAADKLKKTSLEILKRDCFTLEYKSSSQIGQKAFDVVHCLINHRACLQPCSDLNSKPSGSKSTKRTPLNLPPLLGYFRSPDEESCSQDSISRSSLIPMKEDNVEESMPCISYFHSNSNSTQQKSCVSESTPSKTTFKGCLRDTDAGAENELPKNTTRERKGLSFANGDNKKVGVKRSILKDISNASKKAKTTTTTKKASKKSKVQISGQGHITSFFIKK